MKFISSNGGSYLIMEANQLNNWPGSADMKVYDSIPYGADEGLVTTVNNIPVIVLGMPDNLHACKVKDGALFVTLVSCDDEKDIAKIIKNLPTENWVSRGLFTVMDDLAVFDSAISGNDIAEDNSLALSIATGEYEVLAQTISSDTYELQLLLLKMKTPIKSKTKKTTSSQAKPIPEKTKLLAYTYMKQLMGEKSFDGWEEYYIEEGKKLSYLGRHKEVIGTVELCGDELIVQFKKLKAFDKFKDKLAYYTELQKSADWLEFKTRADNKPRSQLEADIGSFLGTLRRENTLPEITFKKILGGSKWKSNSKEIELKLMFYKGEEIIASLEKKNNELIAQFKAPVDLNEFKEYLSHYTTLIEPEGWLELRLPIDTQEDFLARTGLGRIVSKVRT